VSGGSALRTERSVTRVDVRSAAARTLEFSWRSERSNGLFSRPEYAFAELSSERSFSERSELSSWGMR
jgi:hypothetical protein